MNQLEAPEAQAAAVDDFLQEHGAASERCGMSTYP